MVERRRIAESYSDTNVLFHLLRHVGWGDLVNVGYYTVPTLHHALGGLGWFQRELLRRSLDLLEAEPGDRVLDACCGRGLSTAVLAQRGCDALGVDVQPEQVEESRRRFGDRPGASFAVADVTELSNLGGFDRVHCLEAAFHFGRRGGGRSWARRSACCGRAGGWCWWTSRGVRRTRRPSSRSTGTVSCARRGASRRSSRWTGTWCARGRRASR
nr:hypothetical protein GCM10017745_44220 [Saccharothrix mutabilis subsp. capreolus]